MASQPTPPAAPATPTILVIGNAPDDLSRARRVLERQCFRVLSTQSAQEGLALLGAEPLVAIVADGTIEGTTALDFLRRAMTVDARPRRILVGLPDAALLAAAINQGWLFAVLPRPFDSRALSQTASRAVEAFSQKEEQRRLLDDLQVRVRELESELRASTARAIPLPAPAPEEEYRLSPSGAYESVSALPVARFADAPPAPFQSVIPEESVGATTERELVAVSLAEAQPAVFAYKQQVEAALGLAVRRIEAGLSSGAHPEETAWGMLALLLAGPDGASSPSVRRAASRLVGLAGSGRGGSIAAWALIERFARTQSPSDHDLAEAALAWVSFPSVSTPDLAAVGSLLALTAASEAGLVPEAGARERLRGIIQRLVHMPRHSDNLFVDALNALAGHAPAELFGALSARQRRSGALAGEVHEQELPPLVSTAMAALVFGVENLRGAVVNALRHAEEETGALATLP